MILSLGVGAKYFAAHLPGYPFFIRIFAPFFGYLKSMVGVNILFTIFLSLFFYYFLIKLKLTKNPLLLVAVFLFLPRFLIVRSIGAPESLFILLTLLSLFLFEKENYFLSGLFGALACMTKTPGLLLFVAYFLVIVEKLLHKQKFNWRWVAILLIPAGLLSVFLIYWKQFGDFLAYFHSGDNIHLVFPYSVFNFQKVWVNTPWLEEIIFYFFMYSLTVISLKGIKQRSFFYYGLVFFVASTFVQHRDISRYTLSLWPLACIAFEKFFTSKKFIIACIIILPAIYLYSWNFLLSNLMPIADWAPFL